MIVKAKKPAEDDRLVVQLTVAELRAFVAEAVEHGLAERAEQPGKLLDQKGLAEVLGTSERSIYTLRLQGLPVILLGESPRFDRAEVLAWLRTYTYDRELGAAVDKYLAEHPSATDAEIEALPAVRKALGKIEAQR